MGSDQSDKVTAPFTAEQVESLNNYQQSGVFHPFTCGRCRDEQGVVLIRLASGELRRMVDADYPDHDPASVVVDDRELVATLEGWTCPTCDYTQQWAWAWMADGSWHRMASESWLNRGDDG